jgi:uncharacterized protein YceK
MKALFATIAVIALTGCTSITTPDGAKYSNMLFSKQIGDLEIEKQSGTNYTKVKIKGFQSEAASIVKAASEGVATGLAKGVKP